MTNEDETSPTIWEKLFGKGTWVFLLLAGVILLIIAFKGFETFLAENWSYIIGFVGFMLCFISACIGIQYVSTTLSGDREKEIISGKAQPEGFIAASLTSVLMLVIGVILMVVGWSSYETILPDGASILITITGFFLALYSFQHFAQGALIAIFRPLWQQKWFQYLATMLLLVFAGFALYSSYLSLQE